MLLAKLSTAKTVIFGPVLDSTGAAFTTEVVASVVISKNGAASAALDGSATLTHSAVGVYRLALTANDISSVGECTVFLSNGTYAATPVRINVLPAKVYDSLVGGTDNLEIDVVQLLGTAWLTPGTAGTPDVNAKLWNGLTTVALPLVPTTAGRTLDVSATGEAGIDWANIGSPTTTVAMPGTTIATTQKVDIETIKTQTITAAAGITILASVGTAATSTAQTGDTYALANGVTGFVAIDTVVDAIKAKTDNLPTDPADQSAVEAAITAATSPLATAANLATVAGYLDTEIAAILADTNELQTDWTNGGRLDLILDATATQTSLNTIDDFLDTEVAAIKAVTDKIDTGLVLDGAVYQFTANALELGPSGSGGSSVVVTSTVVTRSVSDTNAITFAWPVSGAAITATKSFNNGSYSACDATVAFLRTEDSKHYYTLPYDVDDRPTAEGQVRYKFIDGTYTRYVVVRVAETGLETQVDNIENGVGYLQAWAFGACADPQTASETYAITVFGSTFTVDMAGQTSTGTRTAPTLTKS